jgi:raffinose/stachyose/melibiose transport system substrate-binding protein
MAREIQHSLVTRRELLGRSALLAAGVFGGGPLLAACGESASSQGASGSTIEVGVLYEAGSPFYEAYQRVADQVECDNDVSVDLIFANTEARPKLQLRWRQDNPPDVDYVFNSGDRTSLHYVTDGQLLDLTSQMQDAEWDGGTSWADAILPAFRKFCQLDGKYYMSPESAVAVGLFYNGKLFDDKGFDPPATWSDLMDISESFRADGISPIAVTGTFQPYMGMWWDYLLLRQIGPDAVMDVAYGDAKLADNPGFLTSANDLADLVEAEGFLDGFEGTDFTAAQASFFQGDAAMILMGSWLQGEMKASIPDDFDLRVASFPTVDGGTGDQAGFFGTALGESVWSESEQPDAAVDYLRLTGAKDEQTQRVEDLGIVSPYTGIPGPPGVDGMAELLAVAESSPVTYYYYGISLDEKLTSAWYGPVAKLFLGDASPEDMVAEIDSNLDRLRG